MEIRDKEKVLIETVLNANFMEDEARTDISNFWSRFLAVELYKERIVA